MRFVTKLALVMVLSVLLASCGGDDKKGGGSSTAGGTTTSGGSGALNDLSLVYVDSRNGTPQLFVAKADGSSPRKVIDLKQGTRPYDMRGAVLLAGVKRASNILRDEEKKDKKSHAGAADAALLREPQEIMLYEAIQKVKKDTVAAINVENFAGAMRALAELRAPVDAFFDKVTVNVTSVPDAAALRANRLALLSEIRAATLNVADFSKIAG